VAGNFIRGAFVEFMPTFLVPLPNVIVFQYNPETMTHTWSPAQAAQGQGQGESNPLAVRGVPGEMFSFGLAMDARDMVADGSVVAQGLAEVSGIYSRIAALEMLLYPTGAVGEGLLGSVSVSAGGISLGGSAEVQRDIPESQLPTVLFVWGPGRILPVKVTSLTITETLYDGLLNPIHADAQVSLQVLTPEELKYVSGPLAGLAQGAYAYSQGLRQVLAVANLANSAESVIGMLPL